MAEIAVRAPSVSVGGKTVLSQASVIGLALVLAYIFYVSAKGDIGQYLSVFGFGALPAAEQQGAPAINLPPGTQVLPGMPESGLPAGINPLAITPMGSNEAVIPPAQGYM